MFKIILRRSIYQVAKPRL